MGLGPGSTTIGPLVSLLDPSWWLPTHTAPTVTVVDLGWDPWEITETPLTGPGAWLEDGDPPPRPLVVTTATRPGLVKAAGVLERLAPWCRRGVVAPPAGLVGDHTSTTGGGGNLGGGGGGTTRKRKSDVAELPIPTVTPVEISTTSPKVKRKR